MKKQALTLVGVLSLLLVAGSALAQTYSIRADVPFSFTVNQTTMPAGQYTISPLGNGTNVLVIQSSDTQAIKLVNANRAGAASSKAADRTKLVFHCYEGDHCFLYQLWVGGMSRGQELPRSAVEREIAANLGSHREVAVVAATQ
jgi:hypothetical protein